MNGRIAALETAVKPFADLWLDWQEYNVFHMGGVGHQDDKQLSLVEYITKHSDTDALEQLLERLYKVYQDEV